jgi:hypothetical protein
LKQGDDASMVYTQIKVSIDPEIAAEFKAACKDVGVSMASEIGGFMADRASPLKEQAAKAMEGIDDTRPKRRTRVKKIIDELERIKDSEETYAERIPENLQGGPAYEAANEAACAIGEAICLLQEAF